VKKILIASLGGCSEFLCSLWVAKHLKTQRAQRTAAPESVPIALRQTGGGSEHARSWRLKPYHFDLGLRRPEDGPDTKLFHSKTVRESSPVRAVSQGVPDPGDLHVIEAQVSVQRADANLGHHAMENSDLFRRS
jgi:hypothetical protein